MDDETTQQNWTPQAGPQSEAIRAVFVDELFFGGARGGGKTDYLLGDFATGVHTYGAHWQGILFRRTYPEMDEIVARSQQIYRSAFPGAEYKVGSHTWRFPNGAQLRLRHIENEHDAAAYQGHCVAEGTPVRMADGSYKPIERLQIGDEVATLEGGRRVTATHDVGVKECVALRSGSTVWQYHPVDHRLLTTSAWQSFASVRDNGATGPLQTSLKSALLPFVRVTLRCQAPFPAYADGPSPHYGQSATSSPDPCKFAIPLCGTSPGQPPFSLLRHGGHLREFLPFLAHEGRAAWTCAADAGRYEPTYWVAIPDFPGDYPSYPRFYDAPPLDQRETGPSGAPSPVDVALPSHSLDYRPDGRDSTLGYSPRLQEWYVHPYTQGQRQGLCETVSVACEMTPCGKKRVYDLTVEEVNHYITTRQGIVNKNSFAWLGHDELTNWPNLKPYHMLKACLRTGAIPIPDKRIRATGNPGGVGHTAVKSYFVDPAPGGKEVITNSEDGMSRMFIPARVQDNRILMDNDPGYIERLKAVAHGDKQLVKAWLEGDWDAFVGQYFEMWNPDEVIVPSFEIPKHWPLFGGLDYGEAKPTSFGLYTVDYDGNIYRIMEYYRANSTASQHAYEIDKLIQGCPFIRNRRPSPIYADPSMWVKRKLSEVVNHSPADIFAQQGLYLSPANNDRITGWRVVKDALYKKRFYCFAEWNDNLCRTMPVLPRAKSNPEDIDTQAEDHAADELRYALMHVYKPHKPAPDKDPNPFLGNNMLQDVRRAHRAGGRRYAFV